MTKKTASRERIDTLARKYAELMHKIHKNNSVVDSYLRDMIALRMEMEAVYELVNRHIEQTELLQGYDEDEARRILEEHRMNVLRRRMEEMREAPQPPTTPVEPIIEL